MRRRNVRTARYSSAKTKRGRAQATAASIRGTPTAPRTTSRRSKESKEAAKDVGKATEKGAKAAGRKPRGDQSAANRSRANRLTRPTMRLRNARTDRTGTQASSGACSSPRRRSRLVQVARSRAPSTERVLVGGLVLNGPMDDRGRCRLDDLESPRTFSAVCRAARKAAKILVSALAYQRRGAARRCDGTCPHFLIRPDGTVCREHRSFHDGKRVNAIRHSQVDVPTQARCRSRRDHRRVIGGDDGAAAILNVSVHLHMSPLRVTSPASPVGLRRWRLLGRLRTSRRRERRRSTLVLMVSS